MAEEHKNSLINYISMLLSWRKFIVINSLIISFIVAIYSIFMPKTYNAYGIIAPSQANSSVLSQLASTFSFGSMTSLGGANEETNMFLAILKSRSMAEKIVKKFDLIEKYDSETLEQAVFSLRTEFLSIELNDESMIRIGSSANTKFFHSEEEEKNAKELCSNIVNYLIEQLDSTYTRMQTKQGRYNRIFIEKRYNENIEDIKKIEIEMEKFGKKHGIISLPEQLSAAITNIASIESQISIKEIEFGVLKKSLVPKHQQVQQKKIEIEVLNDKLEELIINSKVGNNSILPPISEGPSLLIKYIGFQREIEVQQLIYEFLTQQYEQAKLQEFRDTPSVQILDYAVPPEKRTSPRRSIIVILSFLFACIMSIVIALLLERWNYLKESKSDDYYQIEQILKAIRHPLGK